MFQLKEKQVDFNDVSLGLSLNVLIYIKGMVNPNQENEGLIFKFRGACIYMGKRKRKPKLCRMKRLDVSQNSHFSFY